MAEINFVATNEAAEKLWSYLIAYRKHMGNQPSDSFEDNITIGAIPLEEKIVVSVEN